MRLLFSFITLCVSLVPAFTQYHGGTADGVNHKSTIQLTLDGVPGGTRGLYTGGINDGATQSTGFGSLGNQQMATLFQGGNGDGYHRTYANATLSGFSLTGLYNGGIGDGFSTINKSTSLAGFDITNIYAGGAGDGFDHSIFAAALDGQSLAGIYSGGLGDGFDLAIASAPLGLSMAMLFKGGVGDGFDHKIASLDLNGFDLRGIYSGGNGDGADHTRYEGIIPLPLTLISFTATPEETYVLLKWTTESEVGTDFFTIEKTKDGREYAWVGEEMAAGFSFPEEHIHYELKDWNPYEGKSFYRLKTTDFDGQISLSHLIEVQYRSVENWAFQLFPNPNTGQHFNISTNGLPDHTVMHLEVFDAAGQQIFMQEVSSITYGSERIDLANKLPPGSYLIRLHHPDHGQQSKILLVGARN